MTQSEFEDLEKDVIVNKYGYAWDDCVTSYKLTFNNINRTIFTLVKKHGIYIVQTDKRFMLCNSTITNYAEIYDILKQRTDAYNNYKETLKTKNETKIDEVESPKQIKKKNIEKLDNKKLNDKIDIDKQKAKTIIEKAKPNFTIKIPKALAKGYFHLNLGSLLNGLTGSLSAVAMGLLMSKLTSSLSELLSSNLDNDTISSSMIESNLNSINISSLIQEVVEEENLMKTNVIIDSVTSVSGTTFSSVSGNTNDIIYDTSSNLNENGNYIDNTLNVKLSTSLDSDKINTSNLKIKSKDKEFYTVNQRNRQDLLESSVVEERLNSVQQAQEIIYNPNYGKFVK